MTRIKVWLDCDPGRDDMIAILLALHLPEIELIGISSIHGNHQTPQMTINCARLLCSFGSSYQIENIPIAEGVHDPLIAKNVSFSNIHGDDGLGGVKGILPKDDALVLGKLKNLKPYAVEAMVKALESLNNGEKLTLVGTGAFTNLALLVSTYPHLVKSACDKIVVMGGAEGRGNKSPVAEANILTDPHAASILFNFDHPVYLFPLNLTHQALFTRHIHELLLQPDLEYSSNLKHLPTPKTVLRQAISTNLTYYEKAYRDNFGFSAPPLHDALTIAWVARPHLFKGKRYHVDVELSGVHSFGTTVIDLWEHKEAEIDQDPQNWGRRGKNVMVMESLQVEEFWKTVFLPTVDKADNICVINNRFN